MASRLIRTYWICPEFHRKIKRISWVIEQEQTSDGTVLRDRDITVRMDGSMHEGGWYEPDVNGYGYIKLADMPGWEQIKKCKLKKLIGIKTWTLD